eukprot:c24048_g1_i3 orf=245-3772(-)
MLYRVSSPPVLSWMAGVANAGESMKSPNIGLAYTSEASTQSLELLMKNLSQPRKRWALPDVDIAEDSNMPFLGDTPGLLGQNGGKFIPVDSSSKSNGVYNSVPLEENPIFGPAVIGTGLTSSDIHQISQKFMEILRPKNIGMQDFPVSMNPTLLCDLGNASPQSLSSLVRAVLIDKLPEEIPPLVEFMLKKVTEEFEQHMAKQGEQVIRLKNSLKEQFAREERLISRARLLETLAAGTGEEVKLVSIQLQKTKAEKKQAEEETMAKEEELGKQMKERENMQLVIEGLNNELDLMRRMSQEHAIELEVEKQQLEADFQVKLKRMELLLEESNRKAHELESAISFQIERLAEKDALYCNFIGSQLQSFQELKMALVVTKQEVLNMQRCWQKEIGTLEVELQGLMKAATGYHKVLAENRLLYNEVQDLKGNIRVYCRVRPFLPGQVGVQGSVDFIGENGDITIVNPNKQGKNAYKTFNFNKVFGASATQEEVFMDTQPLIRSVLDGYNVCIFAYGQTGSGKTFTMSGPNISSERVLGVNYRALNDLFQISQRRKDVFKYEVGAQMIEIYNEQVRDLLVTDGASKRLGIRNNSQLNGLNVPDASMFAVNSIEDVLELMKIGQKHRAVGATALNERSSRSHSVLTVHVQGIELSSGSLLRGCLHLVDLAGSERVDKSEATGDRLREAQHINKSLSALGDVISSLAQKSAHIPYRNSKLTQLLQDSLGGQAKALMFVHISPDIDSYGETISTLKFAERVASVELGAARSHKESKEVRELKEQIASLKDLVAKKDADIVRIQSIKDSHSLTGHNIMSFEKLKAKELNVSSQDHRSVREVQQQRSYKHFLDGSEIPELNPLKGQSTTLVQSGWAQKRSSAPLFHDTFLQESESGSPASSLRETKVLPGKEEERSFKALHHSGSTQNRPQGNSVNTLLHVHGNAPHDDIAMEQEASSKDWRDRMWGSTDSSFPETTSLDEFSFSWDSGHTGNADVEPLAPYRPAAPSFVRRVLDRSKSNKTGKWPNSQEPPLTWPEQVSKHRDQDANQSSGYGLNASNEMHFQTDGIESKDGDVEDKVSDLSDGELSQTETEVSLLSSTEQTSLKEYNSGKMKRVERRRLSQLQLPPRNERRLSHRGQTHSRMRRHTSIAPPIVVGADRLLFKRKPSAGSKSGVSCGCYPPMTK